MKQALTTWRKREVNNRTVIDTENAEEEKSKKGKWKLIIIFINCQLEVVGLLVCGRIERGLKNTVKTTSASNWFFGDCRRGCRATGHNKLVTNELHSISKNSQKRSERSTNG